MKTISTFTTFLMIIFYYILLSFGTANGQATTASPTNTPGAITDYLGWSTANDLDFKTGGLQRMRLMGSGGATDGFLGIGMAFTTPAFQLEVADNINLTHGTFPNYGYRYRIFYRCGLSVSFCRPCMFFP